ncbi:Gfo/Idh/MocA family oxidoreductase [Echinicola marina]|uniref:Gfo/Idh/MocA family protein n=1 Tax=Echinicola marina TaxID=2859768 RepID=UPI001CF66C8A|nr:Gfo/Idh/MocA family oxidoreductase [Echinicola marina]UCS94638.1 Gfo/Idh/MocA family oxidoreductase [Echinicola marina]
MQINQRVSLPNEPLPIVIIGAGGIVKDAHLPAYKMAGFRVQGIFDPDIKKARSLQQQFPGVGQVYMSLSDLIEDGLATRAVFDIAVPASKVNRILEELPKGAAVLIQKPMGETLEQAEAIHAICQRKKLVSAVNFQLRYAPYVLAARDLIDRGLLGSIYDIEIKVNVYTPWQLWDFLFELPRMEILYHSIHYLDLVRSFLGDPNKVYASTIKHPKMPDLASTRSSIILDYDEYTQARVMTNHGHEFGLKHQESYLKIEGTKGAIKIRIGLSLDYPKGMPPIMEYTILEDGKGWQELPLEGGWFPHAFVGTMAGLQRFYQGETEDLPHSTADALQTMKLVETAYRSSEEGGTKF